MSGSSPQSSSRPLSAYGWDSGFAEQFARFSGFSEHAGGSLVPARIVRVDRGRCDAVIAEGSRTAVVQADTSPVASRDPMLVACTGDWAALDAGALAVRALLPRRTAIVRSTSPKRSEGQVLAANVDHAVIAVSMSTGLDLGRLERFLALAWESGAQPLVVLTKADLAADAGYLVADAEATAPGVQVLAVSAATGEGMDVLGAVLAAGTSVLIGWSGAGKSTLANALLGEQVQAVHTTRDSDGKGRHTTTTRDLLPLPSGGVLIDTPGLRGVGLWDAESGLHQVFSEIEDLADECRFHDCSHNWEPGCAVLAALEDGTLPERRLGSYRKLLRENWAPPARGRARREDRLAHRRPARRRAAQALEGDPQVRTRLGRHQAALTARRPIRGRAEHPLLVEGLTAHQDRYGGTVGEAEL